MIRDQKRVGFFETLQLIYSDYTHWCKLLKNKKSFYRFMDYFLRPGTIAVFIHRIVYYLHNKNFVVRLLARFIYLFNICLTGADISPGTKIGKGCIFLHSVAMVIDGRFGDNVIISAKASIGGDGRGKDVGTGGGLPVIGNNVKIGSDVLIIGGIVIGDGVNFAACTKVFTDIESYVLVAGSPGKPVRKISKDYSIFGGQDK